MPNVTVDLGEVGSLLIEDVSPGGVSVIRAMKETLDLFDPPGEGVTRTNAEYKDILLRYIDQRGRGGFAHAANARFRELYAAANPVPALSDYVTLTPPA